MRHHYTSIRMAKTQSNDTTKRGEDVEQQKLSLVAGGNADWEESLAARWLVTKPNIQSSNHTPWYLSRIVEYFCPYKYLHTGVYSTFIYNCQNLEATKLPYSKEVDKYPVVHQNNKISILR